MAKTLYPIQVLKILRPVQMNLWASARCSPLLGTALLWVLQITSIVVGTQLPHWACLPIHLDGRKHIPAMPTVDRS